MQDSSATLTYVSQMLKELAKLLEKAGHDRFAANLLVVCGQMSKELKSN